jgi:hypothetical protein
VHPERARKDEPEPTGEIGQPPRCLNKAERDIWDEYVAEAPPGVLRNRDRKLLEDVCRLQLKARKRMALVGELSLLAKLRQEMGLGPASSSKVSVAKRQKSLREMLEAAPPECSTDERPN